MEECIIQTYRSYIIDETRWITTIDVIFKNETGNGNRKIIRLDEPYSKLQLATALINLAISLQTK